MVGSRGSSIGFSGWLHQKQPLISTTEVQAKKSLQLYNFAISLERKKNSAKKGSLRDAERPGKRGVPQRQAQPHNTHTHTPHK